MSTIVIGEALKARLLEDDTLRALLIELLPEDADVSEEAISLRFAEQVAPGTIDLPCVIWSREDAQASGARCGGFGQQRLRYRVEVVATGESLEVLEPARARIEELLAGWATTDFDVVLAEDWGRKDTGAAGAFVRLGNYYTIIE
jgi:hypothetical protein